MKYLKRVSVWQLVLGIVILLLIVGIAVNASISTPSTQNSTDVAWLQTEADSLFGSLAKLAPQKAAYHCSLVMKLISTCDISVQSIQIRDGRDAEIYMAFAQQLSTKLVTSGWKKYLSQYAKPDISADGTSAYIAYSKTKDNLYCELLFTASFGHQAVGSSEPTSWYIRCKPRA